LGCVYGRGKGRGSLYRRGYQAGKVKLGDNGAGLATVSGLLAGANNQGKNAENGEKQG
jgi:hypothetical protein